MFLRKEITGNIYANQLICYIFIKTTKNDLTVFLQSGKIKQNCFLQNRVQIRPVLACRLKKLRKIRIQKLKL